MTGYGTMPYYGNLSGSTMPFDFNSFYQPCAVTSVTAFTDMSDSSLDIKELAKRRSVSVPKLIKQNMGTHAGYKARKEFWR